MKQNILVATDFSQRSFDVIQKASEFANTHNFELHVVHILEKSFFNIVKDKNTIEKNFFGHLKEKLPFLQEHQFHCKEGDLEEEIENYVKKLNIFMIIIGSSGERSFISKQFLGSSIKSIVRAVDVPCLVLKNTTNIVDFSTIMLPTDLSEKSKIYIHKIHTLFPNSKIELLYSYVVPFEGRLNFYGLSKDETVHFQDNIHQMALDEAYDFYQKLTIDRKKVKISLIKEGLNPEAFVAKSDDLGCNLIALHTTGHFSFFAFDLLEHANKDILITKID